MSPQPLPEPETSSPRPRTSAPPSTFRRPAHAPGTATSSREPSPTSGRAGGITDQHASLPLPNYLGRGPRVFGHPVPPDRITRFRISVTTFFRPHRT
ncbi:hypothetical protein GCM10012275_33850 [Longimycelium tulufanense]|uniref:Uncharacterized protein n=1 Tax=Longimycelium tulufanense TaxID=907463 RepID=A0A8J3CFR0_9PSEU|nr:hypothetical protein GCM10012275_33850 [Longimycelium tulufanense]